MITREKMRTFVLAGAVAASVCACKERAGVDLSADGSAVPAVWEPIDRNFQGCEGG